MDPGLVLDIGGEGGDTAVHDAGRAAGRIGTAVDVHFRIHLAILDVAVDGFAGFSVKDTEDEAGDAAEGKALVGGGSGRSDFSRHRHILDCGTQDRTGHDAHVGRPAGGHGEVGLDVEILDHGMIQDAEQAEGGTVGDILQVLGYMEVPEGVAAAVELAGEGVAHRLAGIVSVPRLLHGADRDPVGAEFGEVEVGLEFHFAHRIHPAGDGAALIDGGDEVPEFVDVRDAADPEARVDVALMAQLADRDSERSLSAREHHIPAARVGVGRLILVVGGNGEGYDGTLSSADARGGIGLDPVGREDDPIRGVGRDDNDLRTGGIGSHVIDGRPVGRDGIGRSTLLLGVAGNRHGRSEKQRKGYSVKNFHSYYMVYFSVKRI